MSHFAAKRILCPVDLSAASPVVLRWASLWAEAYHAQLVGFHADWWDYPPYFFSSQVAELQNEPKRRRAALDSQLAALLHDNVHPDVPRQISISDGHPIEAILKEAAGRHADLIVMGSHGRSGLERIRLGSVAENVLRAASVPILVVRSHAGAEPPPRVLRVLCPVNFTPLGRRCLEVSADIAAAFRAQLIALHSVEDGGSNFPAFHNRLCEWLPEQLRRQCDLSETVQRGDPAEQVLLAARSRAVDLIVLGAQHRPFLEFTTLGTTTERVMRHSDAAVLVLPVGEAVPSPQSPMNSEVSTRS